MPTPQAIFLREYFFLPPKKNLFFLPFLGVLNFFATPQQSTTDKHLDRTTQETNRLQHDTDEETRTGKTGLGKVAVQCSADTFVVNQSLIIRINICGESHHLRQARKC